MKIYSIAGKQYSVIGEDLYEVTKVSEWNGTPVFLTHDEAESTSTFAFKRKYKTKAAKTYKKGTIRHCKNCGEAGHRSDHCPNGDGTLPPDEVAKPAQITKEQVDELRAKGLDSLRIAAKLHTTLAEVNKHW